MKPNFDVELLPEAISFLEGLDDKTREKIYYNIKKSQFVNDKELFKKLTEYIWEFRTIIQWEILSTVFILGEKRRSRNLGCGYTRNTKENPENTYERN